MITVHHPAVESLSFSPDGAWLASGGFDESLRVWESTTGHILRQFKEPSRKDGYFGSVSPVVFHPSGGLIAYVAPNQDLIVRETVRWQQVPILDDEVDTICVAFSPDGRTLAVSFADGSL